MCFQVSGVKSYDSNSFLYKILGSLESSRIFAETSSSIFSWFLVKFPFLGLFVFSGVDDFNSGVYVGVLRLGLLFTGDNNTCFVVFPKVCVGWLFVNFICGFSTGFVSGGCVEVIMGLGLKVDFFRGISGVCNFGFLFVFTEAGCVV